MENEEQNKLPLPADSMVLKFSGPDLDKVVEDLNEAIQVYRMKGWYITTNLKFKQLPDTRFVILALFKKSLAMRKNPRHKEKESE